MRISSAVVAPDTGLSSEDGWIDMEHAFGYSGQQLRVMRGRDVQPIQLQPKNHFAAEMDHPKLPPWDLEAARQINLRAFAALWPELVG